MPVRRSSTVPRGTRQLTTRLLFSGIFLVALNLRVALVSLPPLVHTIEHDLGISSAVAGLLTTLPVLCMGLFAPVAQRLAHAIGREQTVGVALVVLLVGLLARLGGSHLSLLLLSSLLAGIGIALAGTVLPGVVKEFFTERSGAGTAAYLLAMMLGATAASALAVPLMHALGSWQLSLAAWSALAVVGLAAWAPVLRARGAHADAATTASSLPWRSGTAWLLASFLSLQSFAFYSEVAWISPSYEDRGWRASDAGLLLALFSVVQLGSALGVPLLADRLHDRRVLIAVAVGACLAGLVGVAVAPDAAPVLWVALMGVGQGGGFAIGLVKLVDYAPSPAASARLSALVFLTSYSAAAAGPVTFGALRDATGGFRTPYVVLAIVVVVQLALVPRLRPGRLAEAA